MSVTLTMKWSLKLWASIWTRLSEQATPGTPPCPFSTTPSTSLLDGSCSKLVSKHNYVALLPDPPPHFCRMVPVKVGEQTLLRYPPPIPPTYLSDSFCQSW